MPPADLHALRRRIESSQEVLVLADVVLELLDHVELLERRVEHQDRALTALLTKLVVWGPGATLSGVLRQFSRTPK